MIQIIRLINITESKSILFQALPALKAAIMPFQSSAEVLPAAWKLLELVSAC